MLKKILVALIAANMSFSGLLYAQQMPSEELTAEDVALLMSTLDKKPEGIPSAVWWVGGSALLLGTGYAVKKIMTDPTAGKHFVAAMDPVAYSRLQKMAGTKAEKAAVEASVKGGKAIVAEAAQNHSAWLKRIRRGNYWSNARASYTMHYGTGSETAAAAKEFARSARNMERADKLLAAGATKNSGRYLKNLKRAGKWGLAIALVGYTIFGGNDEQETTINNNRLRLERDIKKLMSEDKDALAIFVYNLPDDQRQVAYGIISEDSVLYSTIKMQVEEALSEGNIKFIKETEEAAQEQQYKDEISFSGDEDTSSIKGWSWGY